MADFYDKDKEIEGFNNNFESEINSFGIKPRKAAGNDPNLLRERGRGQRSFQELGKGKNLYKLVGINIDEDLENQSVAPINEQRTGWTEKPSQAALDRIPQIPQVSPTEQADTQNTTPSVEQKNTESLKSESFADYKSVSAISNNFNLKNANKEQLVANLPNTPIHSASADTSAKLSGEEQIFVNALLGLGVSRQKALEVLGQIKSGERDRKVLMDGLLSVNPALAATLQVSGIFDKIIDGLLEYYSKNQSQQNISSPPSQAEKEEYLSKEEQERLIKQREYYHNLKTALPTAVERTNQDLAKDKKQPFSFDGLMKKIEKGSGKQDDPNEGKKQVERINREVADKVQKLHRVDSQSPRQIDPTAIRNTILVRDYTEAQKAVGGDEPQRKILEQRFNNLKPDGAEGEISQKAVMSKANAMFKAATGKDGPENEKDRRLLENFRNSVILEWMPNAIKQDKQSGKSDDNQKSKDPVGSIQARGKS